MSCITDINVENIHFILTNSMPNLPSYFNRPVDLQRALINSFYLEPLNHSFLKLL